MPSCICCSCCHILIKTKLPFCLKYQQTTNNYSNIFLIFYSTYMYDHIFPKISEIDAHYNPTYIFLYIYLSDLFPLLIYNQTVRGKASWLHRTSACLFCEHPLSTHMSIAWWVMDNHLSSIIFSVQWGTAELFCNTKTNDYLANMPGKSNKTQAWQYVRNVRIETAAQHVMLLIFIIREKSEMKQEGTFSQTA